MVEIAFQKKNRPPKKSCQILARLPSAKKVMILNIPFKPTAEAGKMKMPPN
jgi:hypothetical protein